MQKKYFIYSFVAILVVGIAFIIYLYFSKQNNNIKIINNIIDTVLNSNGSSMIYIAKSDSEDYKAQLQHFKLLVDEYGLNYYYINLDNLSTYKQKDIYKRLGIGNDVYNTITIIYEDGKLKNSIVGITGFSRLYNVLKENDLVVEKELPLSYLNTTNFVDKLDETRIVLGVGSYQSNYSNDFERILWNIKKEYNIEIKFLYLCDLSESEGDLFESKIKNFKEFEIKVPSLMLIENGTLESAVIGLTSEEEYVEFLKEYDIIS